MIALRLVGPAPGPQRFIMQSMQRLAKPSPSAQHLPQIQWRRDEKLNKARFIRYCLFLRRHTVDHLALSSQQHTESCPRASSQCPRHYVPSWHWTLLAHLRPRPGPFQKAPAVSPRVRSAPVSIPQPLLRCLI